MASASRTFVVFGFESTHAALDGEALLQDMGIEVVPIPAPASLSGRCGIALRVEPEAAGRALIYLSRAGIVPDGQGEIEDV